MPHAIVIGAGIGGLATALRLKRRGWQVTIFEAASGPGGKLREFELGSFRFDAGPSLFTLPKLVENLLGDSSTFEYMKLDRSCHYFWEDGTRFIAWADRHALAKEIEDVFDVDPQKVLAHLDHSAMLYRTTSSLFMHRSLHRLKSFVSLDVLKALFRVRKLRLFTTMNQANQAQLQHEKIIQLFNRYATYNGSDPYRAPGVLNIIPHLEHNIGTFFPKGGMYAITKSIYQAAVTAGVQIHFKQKVERILTTNSVAHGVLVNGQHIEADAVVSNADIYPTYRFLLPNEKAPEKTLQSERSSSALIYYWGIDRSFNELHLHNILFSKDYEAEFKAIFEDEFPIDDPTVYINITSKCEPNDAPEGKENWFVMINVPTNKQQYTEDSFERMRTTILNKIERTLGVNLRQHIIEEERLDPISIELNTSSHMGALYGSSSNDRMAAFLRHPNFSKNIDHLYFCGGSVHPGGGIPLCLNSAKIVDDLITEDHG